MATVQELVQQAKQQINEIDTVTAQQLIVQKMPLILDVREPSEYQEGHLPNAVNVPRGVLEFKIEQMAKVDDELLVYCQVGGRSALAAQSLMALGFFRVHSLAGGYEAWLAQKFPVTR